MLKIYNFVVIICSLFPLVRLMTNKLMALFNMEGTMGKKSLRETNIWKIILSKNKDYIGYTYIP